MPLIGPVFCAYVAPSGLWFLGDEFRGFVSTLAPGQILPALRALISGDPHIQLQLRFAHLCGRVWETSIAQL